jgi:hypothetical protein
MTDAPLTSQTPRNRGFAPLLDASESPLLSVVLTAGPLRDRAEAVLRELAAQTVAGRIEVVVVDLASRGARRLTGPAGLAITEVPSADRSMEAGRAEGVRRARAPIVALIEDHAHPAPDWAAALLDAHAGPWDAVGYGIDVANPDGWVSRGALLTEYGTTTHPARRRRVASLPSYNVSYKRDVLLSFGGQLETLLATELEMRGAFAARGLRMLLEPRAVVAHESIPSLRGIAGANFAYGRRLGAGRARTWGWVRRAVWALGSPLSAPAVRGFRLTRALGRRRRAWRRVPAALPVLAVAYSAEALGESVGYVGGPGEAVRAQWQWEMEIPRAIRPSPAGRQGH